MAQAKLAINYDPKADVLYCSYGPPQEAISEETSEGIITRRNPETDELVGFTVVDFSRRFLEHPGDTIIPEPEREDDLQPA